MADVRTLGIAGHCAVIAEVGPAGRVAADGISLCVETIKQLAEIPGVRACI
jgi:hypothetical protein